MSTREESTHRFLVPGYLLALVAFGLLPPSTHSLAAETAEWHGASLLNGGKGYVATPMGQVHYRDVGNRNSGTPFLLLHQTPWSMVEFADIQNAIAIHGRRAITIDTPGYGMSDSQLGSPTIGEFADNLVPVLDALQVRRVIVGGHHTGASIAVAFAARHPDRVAGLILHGVPLYTAAERAERLASSGSGADRTLQPDGSHLSRNFQRFLQLGADPTSSASTAYADLRSATWAVIALFMEDRDIGHNAAYSYDMQPDLMKIGVPTLVLSDGGDTLHLMDQKAVKLRPDFHYVEFSEGKAMSLAREPERWARLALEFAGSTESPR